jgi:hypothetical protein
VHRHVRHPQPPRQRAAHRLLEDAVGEEDVGGEPLSPCDHPAETASVPRPPHPGAPRRDAGLAEGSEELALAVEGHGVRVEATLAQRRQQDRLLALGAADLEVGAEE